MSHWVANTGCTYQYADPQSAGPEVQSTSMGTSGPSRIRTLMISLPTFHEVRGETFCRECSALG